MPAKYDSMSLDDLVKANQDLGRQADKIKAQRKVIADQIRELVAKGPGTPTPPAAKGEKKVHAVVAGKTLTAKASSKGR